MVAAGQVELLQQPVIEELESALPDTIIDLIQHLVTAEEPDDESSQDQNDSDDGDASDEIDQADDDDEVDAEPLGDQVEESDASSNEDEEGPDTNDTNDVDDNSHSDPPARVTRSNPKHAPRGSVLDDQFFKLDEMNRFLLEEDMKETRKAKAVKKHDSDEDTDDEDDNIDLFGAGGCWAGLAAIVGS